MVLQQSQACFDGPGAAPQDNTTQPPRHRNQRPLDLDTVVDEDGANLSATQRFVISLARLLLRATPIILLDEPMQGRLVPDEDGTLRDSVQSLLLRSFPAATMVCIAHQTESVSHYDRFLSLAQGRLVRDVTVSND
jgi:ATP-binding cassette subfamily C protein CydC